MTKILTLALAIAFSYKCLALSSFKDTNSGLMGIKDSKGEVIFTPQFDMILGEELDDGLIEVIKAGKFLRLDVTSGKTFESLLYDNGHDYYQDGLARFVKEGKVGFHNESGDVVIKASYDFAFPFEEGKSIVCQGCWSQYDKMPHFRAAGSSACLVPTNVEYKSVVGGKWGVIDTSGKTIIPLKYESFQQVKDMK